MSGILKKVSAFLLFVILVFSMSMTSFADTNPLQSLIDKIEKYENSNDTAKKKFYEEALATWEGIEDSSGQSEAYVKITFGGITKEFTNSSTDAASDSSDDNYINAYSVMNSYLKKVGEINSDVTTVQGAKAQIDELVKNMNGRADIAGGADSLKSIMPLVNTITGIIVVIVLLGMAIFTAFDVAYLVFPVAKQQMDKAGSSGNRMASKTDNKTGEARFRWVTDDAIQAYTQATEGGKHPLTTYLKKRLISYIAVAVVVFMLMSGNLAVIINFVLQMLGSVFDMLGKLSVG